MEDHFSLLTPENRHAASPRFVPDQETVVYFDNPLSTPSGFLMPGPQDMSRNLVKFNLHDAMMQSKSSFQKGVLGKGSYFYLLKGLFKKDSRFLGKQIGLKSTDIAMLNQSLL